MNDFRPPEMLLVPRKGVGWIGATQNVTDQTSGTVVIAQLGEPW